MSAPAPPPDEVTTLDETLAWSRSETRARFRDYVNPELASPLASIGADRTMVSASGATVVDDDGVDRVATPSIGSARPTTVIPACSSTCWRT